MTQHTWRLGRRANVLGRIFSDHALENVWKKYVKKGLRNQIIDDLHDYNDINNNRKSEFQNLRIDLLNGRYSPAQGFIYTSEKSNGVCRHVLIPSVRDAVFLQALVEFLIEDLLRKQPSSHSFFSRSHSPPKTEFRFQGDDVYPWFVAWKRFSKKRQISISTHDYIAVTDIANYFDSIRLDQLRNIVSSIYRARRSQISEVVLDLIIEAFNSLTWVPDYLPRRHIGLTQVNFDAPRLFAHVYLYEIDEFLKISNKDLFLRWVDDISFPGNNKEVMKNLLGQIDDLLYARGCRLNLSKTKILTAKQAYKYFQYDANTKLEKLENKPRLTSSDAQAILRLIAAMENEKYGHWDKICARAIRLLSKHNESLPDALARRLLRDYPYLRKPVFDNMVQSGYSIKKMRIIVNFLDLPEQRCDASMFLAWSTLASWESISVGQLRLFRHEASKLCSPSALQRNAAFFVGSLRYTILYEDPQKLCRSLLLGLSSFGHIDFVARQVAAALAAVSDAVPEKRVVFDLLQYKYSNATSSIIANLQMIEKDGLSNPYVKGFILPSSLLRGYGLERLLLAMVYARSPQCLPREKVQIANAIAAHNNHEALRRLWEREVGP